MLHTRQNIYKHWPFCFRLLFSCSDVTVHFRSNS